MKIITLTLVAFVFFSCTKRANEQKKLFSESTQKTNAIASVPEGLTESIEVRCLGECNNSDADCGLRWNLGNGTVDCTCTGCTMQITTPSEMKHLSNLLELVGNSFAKLTKEQYHSDGVPTIKEFHLQYDRTNNTDLLTIEFENPNGIDTYASVLYAIKYNSIGNIQKTIEIDCQGTCDCRERWVIETGSAECTCTGDCKMTITTIVPEP